VACGALLESSELPLSKRTRPIDNGTNYDTIRYDRRV